jgi:hypothetical protein
MPERAHEGRVIGTIRHAFISYVREDSDHVERLQRRLEAVGIRVWRDTADLWPGEDWRAKIRQAIQDNALVFIACFSHQSLARRRSYQNEELVLAIEELRRRPLDDPWLIPVRFSDCDIPDYDIGAGRTLNSIQRADVFGDHADEGAARLVTSVLRILVRTADAAEAVTPDGAAASGTRGTVERGQDDARMRTRDALNGLPEHIRQLSTHRKLISQTEQQEFDAKLALDAIIVPASRPAQNLEHAVTLARAAQCALLILCSQRAEPAEAHQLLAERSFNDAIVVSLPRDYRHELLDFRGLASIKDDLPAACSYYVTDLSTKRNVGLILARMLGWRRIFFLDDDIRDINPADVDRTVDLLGSYATAGMRVTNFPDNSIVGHAHRMTGGLQDVFVTGAALAVDCQQNTGFFPDIYKGDWLFFFDVASAGRLGSSRRKVTQVRYNPFADPKRAAWQEFGDVLAEGLYALLDHRMDWRYATDGYWLDFLDARQRFLEAIVSRANIARPDIARPDIREELLLSVEMALKCSITIGPELLERYVLLWRQDLREWQQRIAGISPMPSLDAALQELGLPSSINDSAAGQIRYFDLISNGPLNTFASAMPEESPKRAGLRRRRR